MAKIQDRPGAEVDLKLGVEAKALIKRGIMTVVGIFLCGVSVGIFKTAQLGTDPFTCLITGLSNVTGLTYGMLFTIACAVLLAGVFFLDRHYIGLATILNVCFLGLIVDGTLLILEQYIISPPLFYRFLLMLGAILLMCFSSSLYYTADMGVSVYDAYALILADKKIAPFQFCRIGTDLFCVLVGFAFQAWPGIGTLVTAFFMGPVIVWFNVHFSRPMLQGRMFKR